MANLADAVSVSEARTGVICVSGYYGCGNMGDEAVLAGMLAAIEQAGGPHRQDVTVLSQDPPSTRALHGVLSEYRMSRKAVRESIRHSKLLISGGGSLLQDVTSIRSLLYYLWVARQALSIGRPVMFYAQGIGPLKRAASRWMVRRIADRAAWITVRDEGSAVLLKEIGVSRPTVEVVADPAFVLAPSAEGGSLLRTAMEGKPRPWIGLSLRPWESGPGAGGWAEMADCVVEQVGGSIAFIPMQPPGDVELSRHIALRMRAPAVLVDGLAAPEAALGAIAELDALVAMRLHALIFGAVGGVPLVGLSYDPKVARLLQDFDLTKRNIDIRANVTAAVPNCVTAGIAEGELGRERLRRVARDMASRAAVSAHRAVSLLS